MSEEENRYPIGWQVVPVAAPWSELNFSPGTEDTLRDLFPGISVEQINLLRNQYRHFREQEVIDKSQLFFDDKIAAAMRLFADDAATLLNRFDESPEEVKKCITNAVSLACGKKRRAESYTVDIMRRLLVSLVDGIEGHEIYGQWIEKNRKGGRKGRYPGRVGADWDIIAGIYMTLECEILRRVPTNDEIKKNVAALIGSKEAKRLRGTIERYLEGRKANGNSLTY